MITSSEDGGETWSAPTKSSLPDARTRGSLAVVADASNRPVWLYATSNVVSTENGRSYRRHLTLYGSKDRGATWKEVKRVHFGGWTYPNVVRLGPNRCGICFRRETHEDGSQQIRFVKVENLWPEK